jgi:hypothetical protein
MRRAFSIPRARVGTRNLLSFCPCGCPILSVFCEGWGFSSIVLAFVIPRSHATRNLLLALSGSGLPACPDEGRAVGRLQPVCLVSGRFANSPRAAPRKELVIPKRPATRILRPGVFCRDEESASRLEWHRLQPVYLCLLEGGDSSPPRKPSSLRGFNP